MIGCLIRSRCAIGCLIRRYNNNTSTFLKSLEIFNALSIYTKRQNILKIENKLFVDSHPNSADTMGFCYSVFTLQYMVISDDIKQ